MPGPLPKGTNQRERDTKRRNTAKEATLVNDGEVRGPTIRQATGRNDWNAQATAYWETWRTSPNAQIFTAVDWQRLAMLVPLVDQYWSDPIPDKGLMAEIRQNESSLGATVADRARLRLKVEEASDAEVLSIAGDSDAELLA